MEQRPIDANELKARLSSLEGRGGHKYYRKAVDDCLHKHFPRIIDDAPTIDPETLPIVRQLREELARVTAERDAAVEDLRGDCEKCAHYRVTWNGCTPDYECPLSDRCLNRDMWEWRGPRKEE